MGNGLNMAGVHRVAINLQCHNTKTNSNAMHIIRYIIHPHYHYCQKCDLLTVSEELFVEYCLNTLIIEREKHLIIVVL